ncbi:hypothetical protein GCK72_005702 [Caenorhabditis remanei]|uniref:Uncharacterized protein n=2 Tax=Caenorhabditis remanei TaxID=31234 RepID=E3MN28_CAERE|nr:hypothetical protein GCK72_005702 [Caenorhabditis remanei]EFP05159.1 hypothetical protein CRE_04060 [Caenorhabditis remanei]KAF1765749.1 hypothetical protein GCK72_005702 [Caenorhabditis remanei]
MRLFFYFLVLCNVISTLLAYDVRDFENLRQNTIRNIASLENILEHRIAGAHRHHKIPKSRRIGGNIVMG